MSKYVKNTILDTLMGIVAPHHCFGCSKTGTPLCDNCKYDIVDEAYSGCICCGKIALRGICGNCTATFSRAWCVGEREDALKSLIDAYKFYRARAAGFELASLLNATLPVLPSNIVVTSVPTVSNHIRVRGYDHAALIAQQFAALRGLRYSPVLVRATKDRQRGASRKQRYEQAKRAFLPRYTLDSSKTYLLVDDVVTTGASLVHAAEAMQKAGAGDVWVAVVARQPLQ